MTKKKPEMQWQKLGESALSDWRAAVDDKGGVRLEQVSTGKGWGPWHMRYGETLVSADTLRAKSLVKEAAKVEGGTYKDVPLTTLEALETYAAARLKEPAQAGADAQGTTAEKAPELRVLLPAFEQLANGGEYVLDAPGSPLATWKVRVVEDVTPQGARLELEEPGVDKPIHHGPYVFDAEGGLLMGVGPGCFCGRPDTVPGSDHSHVLDAFARAEAALTADVEQPKEAAPPVAPPPAPAEERPRIIGLSPGEVKGDLLRRWLKVAHVFDEGGKLSEAIESLPVPLTPAARLVKADLLTGTYEEDAELDVEEKRFKDGMKKRREDVDKRRQTLVGEIQSRKEYRDVRTVEVVVYPLRAVWRVRTDTYEVVDSRAMDLADQAAPVYAEDDTNAPFHSRPRVEASEDTDEEGEPNTPQGPRPKKKRAPSSAGGVSLSLTTSEALDLEPEEKRRKATPDATSDMTVSAPVKHRCQRARCSHSEADHSGSSGQCMASIRAELDGRPGETCACTAYVPPPGARATKPEATPAKTSEPAASSISAALPSPTGARVELADGWQAQERGTGWWLSHADGPDNVGPFFPIMDGGARYAYLEQPMGRAGLDAWASANEHVLGAMEAKLTTGAVSFARHYPLGDDAPGWLLAVVGPTGGPLTLFLVNGTETSPALEWNPGLAPDEHRGGLDAVGHDDESVVGFVAWSDARPGVVTAANHVIRRGDVRELPQPVDGMVLQ